MNGFSLYVLVIYCLSRKLTKQSLLYSLLVLGKLCLGQYVVNVEPLAGALKIIFTHIEQYHICTLSPRFY